ncbi:Protein of avirulence locus ImpE [hydrothermal vent metagenome]|uniref:Protein of avirulence locus ImpE n=1 Tax=hydrothermal vent metagenome TaxID=652676 RepID=A0A3B1A8K1_9ZZZZ
MAVEGFLQAGELEETLIQLQAQVRDAPSKAELRIFLFQLLVVMGQWQRALTQLNVAGELDAAALAMVQTYREAIRCEVLRAEVFAGKRSPLLFGQPAQWAANLVEALRLSAEGHYAQSSDLREKAFELAPASTGVCDGKRFDWIADADMRLGPMLEAIVNGQYYWIPFNQIQQITIEEPVDLRDMVWMPAYFVWANGGESVGLIPSRYPGSEACEDDAIRLARKTEWQQYGEGLYFGFGQRVLSTDEDEYSLMDIRSISLDTVMEPGDLKTGSVTTDGVCGG